jgi:hypothetical protein
VLDLQVTGEIQDGLTSWDVLRAALPVGTVSGAPKVYFYCFFGTGIAATDSPLFELEDFYLFLGHC